MSDKLISRRGAFSLLGLAAVLALPTTVLTTSDAEAQAQPSPAAPAPAAPAPSASTPTAPATPGMTRGQARRAGRHERREARRTGRHERREARRNAREMRREARHGKNIYMKSNIPKQQ
jgi:pyruvate/2-oxoglutarate dehydrogenase complex dihydrolipoamide acyltransferase (E2) component